VLRHRNTWLAKVMRWPRGSARLWGVALLGALALASCGSSYTKQDFVQRASGICTDTTRSLRLLTPPSFSGSAAANQKSLATYLEGAAPIVGRESRRLSALPRPSQSAAQARLLRHWLTAVKSSAAGFKKLAAAAQGGDAEAESAANAELAANPVVRLAASYGAHACAGPGATYK
jgi:hypothetical protein